MSGVKHRKNFLYQSRSITLKKDFDLACQKGENNHTGFGAKS